ncbi:MAG: TerB family tellurite resistance protein [Rhizobiales bacterium]|nr:TerB family tellurite resistance protein [Hyphomicrobiales bacterium]
MDKQPPVSRLVTELGAELRLLLPIAMADGALHNRERTMLERYVAARAMAAGIDYDAAELAAALRWAKADPPTPTQCSELAASARARSPDAIEALWEMAQSLSEADGMVTGVERVRLTRLKEILDKAAGT